MSLKKITFLLIYFPLFLLSPWHKLQRLTPMTTGIYTSPWGLVTHYSHPTTPPVADTLLNLRGGLSLGYFGNPVLEATETHKRDSSPNTRDLCVSPGGVAGSTEPAWPMLVEPRTGQEWLWPDATRDSLDPLRPFCWDAVAKLPFACGVGVTELFSQSSSRLFWGRMI